MKIKPTSKNRGVLVELGPKESQMPAQSLSTAPAFRLKKILVPLDFSDCSKKALQYAIAFARQFGAELTLLHVVEPYPVVPEMLPCDLENVSDRSQELEALREDIPDFVPSSTAVRKGIPATEIADAAR